MIAESAKLRLLSLIALCGAGLALLGCAHDGTVRPGPSQQAGLQGQSTMETTDESARDAAALSPIERVLAEDERLGRIRNHAPESAPVADAAREYAAALATLDYSDTPLEFQRAFARHREAWHEMADYLKPFEVVRGEMHALFDQLGDVDANPSAEDFKQRLDKIWSTWAEVEVATVAAAPDRG